MKLGKKGVFPLMLLVALGLMLCAASPGVAGNPKLKCEVFAPPIQSGIQFTAIVRVTNTSDQAIIFNRILTGYAFPDLTVKGPNLASSVYHSIPAGTSSTINVPMLINTNLSSGSLIPIAVTLWFNPAPSNGFTYYTQGYDRGGGVGLAQVK